MNANNAQSEQATDSADERLESLFVLLLGELEQRLSGIQPSDDPKMMSRSINVAMNMLVTVADAGIASFGDQFFAAEIPVMWRLRERSQVVLNVLNAESWGFSFGQRAKATTSTQVMYFNFGHTFVQVFRDLLARLREQFVSTRLKKDFHESIELFLNDLEHRW